MAAIKLCPLEFSFKIKPTLFVFCEIYFMNSGSFI